MFNRDLALIQHPIRLHSSKDLAEITGLVQDRKRWRGLASEKLPKCYRWRSETQHANTKSKLVLFHYCGKLNLFNRLAMAL